MFFPRCLELAVIVSLSSPSLTLSFFHTAPTSLPHPLCMLPDFGEMLTGGKLEAETDLPFSPLCDTSSTSDRKRVFAIQERGLSFTGEDFDVFEGESGSSFAKCRGAMMHLPGKDKMKIRSTITDEETVVLDRVLMTATPTYDIYRGGGNREKLGWIEKELISLTETFDVFMEGSGFGVFKSPPAYRISGNFLEKNFVMKNGKGQVVAKVTKDSLIQFDSFNHYQVQVAPLMDAMLVIACACAIDEALDEENKEKKEEEKRKEGKEGWF